MSHFDAMLKDLWIFGELVCCVVAAELRNSLPDMVVEILQEKLDQKLSEDASRLSGKASQQSVMSTADVSSSHSLAIQTAGIRCEDGLFEFPKNWEPMNASEVF